MRGAVELRRRNNVAAAIGERENGVIERRLPRRCAERRDPAFEQGYALLQNIDGRIADAAVAISLGFEVEQSRAMIGAVEFVGDVLMDRHSDRFGRGIAGKAAVNRKGLVAHRRLTALAAASQASIVRRK